MLFGLPAVGRRWPGGLRSALAFGVPAILAWLLGFHTEALLVVSGSFAVIYGEGRPYRSRWWVVLTAGAALVASVWLGATAGRLALDFGETGWAQMIPVTVLSVLALVAVYVVAALRLGPPGAFFFVLVCAVASYLPAADISATRGAVCAAIGVASALVVAMSGVVRDPRVPNGRPSVRPWRRSRSTRHRRRRPSSIDIPPPHVCTRRGPRCTRPGRRARPRAPRWYRPCSMPISRLRPPRGRAPAPFRIRKARWNRHEISCRWLVRASGIG